jgi:uncharacterized protein
MATYRILSFDGGGIRGIVSLVMLRRLQRRTPELVARTDLIAGTSTGGIIALGLAAGKSVDELIALYRDNGERIFDDSWWDDVVDLGKISGADYDSRNLAKVLRREFGDTRLRELNKQVLIPAFDLDNEDPDPRRRTWKPLFYHNFPGSDSDGEQRVVDVALSTSAAPTYFPSYRGNVDGGVVANNPSMAALTETQDPRAVLSPRPGLEEILMLSVGTGTVLSYVAGTKHDWGYAQWAKPLLNLLLDASMGIADYECRQILRERYHRLAPVFDPGVNIRLDEWKRLPELIAFAESVDLGPVGSWLEQCGW